MLFELFEPRKMLAGDTFAVARPQLAGDLLDHYVDMDAPVNNTQATDDILFVYGKDASAPDVSVNDDVFAGDWGGLGFDQVGVARDNSGQKQILLDTDRDTDPEYMFHFGAGTGTGTAFAGDFNGDGFDDVGVWFADPGAGAGIIVHLKYASPSGDAFPRNQSNASPITPDAVFQFGLKATDVILAGDFSGDGRTDIAAVRNNGASPKDWFVSDAASGATPYPNNVATTLTVSNTYQFGLTAHIPVVGDWDDDGTDNLGAISEGTNGSGVNEWFLDTNFNSGVELTVDYGLPGDIPYTGRFADVLWDGGGDGTSWSEAANWSADFLPAAGDIVIIDDPGTPTIISSGNVSIGSLGSQESISISGGTFQSSGNVDAPSLTVAGGNYIADHTLTTAAFALNSGVLTVTPETSISDVNIDVAGGSIQTAGSGPEIIFGNWMALTGDVTIDIDNDLALSGLHSGVGGIIKDGPSTLRLTNNNSYAGVTTINAGEIFLTSAGLLGSTASGTIVGGSARLRIGQGKINNDAVTLSGVNPSLLTFAGASSFQDGAVILAAVDDANILTSNQLVVRGQISGSVSGAGRFNVGGTAENLTLQFQPSVANTYSATTIVANGNLQTLTSDVIAIPGDVVVGDSDGTRAFLSLARPNTVAPTANVTLNSDAYLDLDTRNSANPFAVNQTINNLTVTATGLSAPVQTSSQIDTTSTQHAFVGTLTVAGTYTQVASASDVTSITGRLALSNTASASNFVVQDGAITPDLTIINASTLIDGITPTALNLSGGGTVDFDGVSMHNGGTSVTGAHLNVDGILGDVNVNSAGLLSGTGTVGNVIANSGATIAPGNSPGILLTGNFTLNAGSTLDIEVGGSGANAGTNYDQVNVTGSVTLGGSLHLIEDSIPVAKQTFTIINNDGTDAVIGTFAGIANGDIVSVASRDFVIRYNGGDGNDVVLLSLSPAIMVTNANDSGVGSLRQAIIDANVDAALDLIHFDIAVPGPNVITLGSDLPAITSAVILDGTSEPDYAGTPIVELSGTGGGRGIEFFGIATAGSQLLGLSLHGFSTGGALEIVDTSAIDVKGNYFGLRANGTTSPFFSSEGVRIENSANVIVGGPNTADRNVISYGLTSGVTVTGTGSDNNIIEGNFIGTNRFGFAAVGNLDGVIVRAGAKNTQIGVAGGAPNVISGNTGRGISVGDFATNGTVIVNNFIGTDRFGNAALTNGAHAVDVPQNPGLVTIGGNTPEQRNVIVGSNGVTEAVRIQNASTVFQGNYVGTDVTGTVGLGGQAGIRVTSAASSIQIGGTAPGTGNLIAGMSSYGIIDQGTSTGIRGNLIGTNASGLQTIGVGNAGIFVDGGQATIIGSPGAGNTIAGVNTVIAQTGHGILLNNAAGTVGNEVRIESNRIGIGIDGVTVLGNDGDGVHLATGTEATIGDFNESDKNVIGGNVRGVFSAGDASIEGNFIGVTSDGVTPIANQVGVRLESSLGTV